MWRERIKSVYSTCKSGKGEEYAPVIGLIVENRNTCDDNSPTVPLTEKQIAELRACAAK